MSEQELLTIDELRQRGQVIEHPNIHNAKFLSPDKQKCPWCNSTFITDYDKKCHLDSNGRYPHDEELLEKLHRIRWKPSNYGDDTDICHIDKLKDYDPQLARAIETQTVHLGQYSYSLSQNGQWVKRRRRSE